MRISEKSFRSADGTRTQVLADLQFDLAPGSFNCLIGPSGCGKTTTLRILLGLDRDYSGSVGLPRGDARIAAVFQEPRLLPWETVDQNIRLALPRGSEVDIGPLLKTLGLEAMTKHYPGELSLGLERRVALARAFALKPTVLFLDEPFVSLDEHTAERLRALLVELWEAHSTTVLMVTHNVREATQLADRLLLLNGRPATLVGDVTVTLDRAARRGMVLQGFLDDLSRRYPDTILS